MRGVITGLKSHSSSFYFITGDDGKEYYSRPGFLFAKKANGNRVWDKFVWNGNGCEFEPRDDPEHKSPVAINVIPDEVIDPRFGLRKANRLKDRQNHIAKVEQKKFNIERNRQLKEAADLRRQLREMNKIYVIQIRDEDHWQDFVSFDGRPIYYKGLRDATQCVFSLKKQYPNDRFRYVKREWTGHGSEKQN